MDLGVQAFGLWPGFIALSVNLALAPFCRQSLFFEPLEGFDSFAVRLDNNESDKNESGFYPGFQHLFVGSFILLKSDILRPRSPCRHVDPSKPIRTNRPVDLDLGVQAFYAFFMTSGALVSSFAFFDYYILFSD